MKILVTGGAGYIGSHTVRELIGKGYDIIVYDNLTTGHEWAVKDCELIIGDIADITQLEKVLDQHNIKAVIHFAASSLVGESVIDPSKYYENNVLGSKRLFDVLISKGVKKIVFSSTCATYGIPEMIPITEKEKQAPINPYGWTKLIIEQILKDYGNAYGLNSIALRYFNAAGAAYEERLGEDHNSESHVIPLILEALTGKRETFSLFGEDYDTADGSCIRDYIHVKDLATAHVLAVEKLLEKRSEANIGSFDFFNLGTGAGISVLELVTEAEKITGKKVPLRICNRRDGDPPILVADNSKAITQLNWNPIYSSLSNIVNSAYKWELIKQTHNK
ncbi:UDP-glucose 4-epimerase GalE [Clostridium aminobutyricum]|uniref:UDP-glucose 4-epimerase n=1 Tax=Clostridium aminobutyricum TaxID=33953 RepID=A0A939DB38_CLOAM|nr:UDP-glucose 4-epimerase GalE [Clostridium aminobutyricum]MBN7774038.1 UDP-glucose 4-epimerase GalE [Clostridium aminobutyricum]